MAWVVDTSVVIDIRKNDPVLGPASAACFASKRAGHAGKRPVADVPIEAFALRFQGLITRNPRHFKTVPTVAP